MSEARAISVNDAALTKPFHMMLSNSVFVSLYDRPSVPGRSCLKTNFYQRKIQNPSFSAAVKGLYYATKKQQGLQVLYSIVIGRAINSSSICRYLTHAHVGHTMHGASAHLVRQPLCLRQTQLGFREGFFDWTGVADDITNNCISSFLGKDAQSNPYFNKATLNLFKLGSVKGATLISLCGCYCCNGKSHRFGPPPMLLKRRQIRHILSFTDRIMKLKPIIFLRV